MLHQSSADSRSLSPEEAQAVMQLWAQRRQEADAFAQAPKVADLAEAMNISPAEVEAMLRQVRMNPPSTPVVPKKIKKSTYFAAAIGIVAFWAVVLVGIYQFGYNNARREAMFFEMGPGMPATAFAPEVSPVAVMPSTNNNLPTGLSIEFRGYRVDGAETTVAPPEVVEAQAAARITQLVFEQTPAPASNIIPDSDTVRDTVNALQLDRKEGVAGIFRFEPMTVSGGGKSETVNIPIPLTDRHEVTDIIRSEIDRRIRIAANKAARLSRLK